MNYSLNRQLSLLALSALTLSTLACKDKKEEAKPEAAKINIKVEAVHTSSASDDLILNAHIDADPAHVVHVYSPLSGRVLNLAVHPGDEVHKGQTVAVLQSGDVAQARSDFEKAKIEVLRADRALDRAKLMLAHEVVSQADFYETKATDDAAHSEQERTRQRIRELGFPENGTSDIANVPAPINGTVLDIGSATGEMQRSLETSTGLATIANLDSVWVQGDLFERDLALVRVGDTVQVTVPAYPDETFSGKVTNIGDALDPNSHTLKVRVVLANPKHRLKPSMFAQMRIQRPSHSSIVLPAAAVLHDGDQPTVYIETAPGKYQTRVVTLGQQTGDKIEVLKGITDGERVVTGGAAFLRQPVGD